MTISFTPPTGVGCQDAIVVKLTNLWIFRSRLDTLVDGPPYRKLLSGQFLQIHVRENATTTGFRTCVESGKGLLS